MLGIALNWLRGNWSTVIVGIAIVALAIWIGALKFALGSVRGQYAELQGEYAELTSEYKILEQKAIRQQAAVAQLEAEAARKHRAGILALAEAKKRAVGLQAKADWLAEQLAKPPRGGTCASAFKSWRAQP